MSLLSIDQWVLYDILNDLGLRYVLSFCQTSKLYRQICNSDSYWSHRARYHGVSYDYPSIMDPRLRYTVSVIMNSHLMVTDEYRDTAGYIWDNIGFIMRILRFMVITSRTDDDGEILIPEWINGILNIIGVHRFIDLVIRWYISLDLVKYAISYVAKSNLDIFIRAVSLAFEQDSLKNPPLVTSDKAEIQRIITYLLTVMPRSAYNLLKQRISMKYGMTITSPYQVYYFAKYGNEDQAWEEIVRLGAEKPRDRALMLVQMMAWEAESGDIERYQRSVGQLEELNPRLTDGFVLLSDKLGEYGTVEMVDMLIPILGKNATAFLHWVLNAAVDSDNFDMVRYILGLEVNISYNISSYMVSSEMMYDILSRSGRISQSTIDFGVITGSNPNLFDRVHDGLLKGNSAYIVQRASPYSIIYFINKGILDENEIMRLAGESLKTTLTKLL